MKTTPIFEQKLQDDVVDVFFNATRPRVVDVYASDDEVNTRNAAYERFFRLRSLNPTWATTYAAIFTQVMYEQLAAEHEEAVATLVQAS